MRQAHWTRRAVLVALCVWAGLAIFSTSSAAGQETPADATATAGGGAGPVMRIEVDGPAQPIPEGQEFRARVLVDNVEHLAAFEFTIAFNADLVSYVGIEDQGAFVSSSERGENISCPEPFAELDSVTVVCSTPGPPLCLGGMPGAAGSGLLGTAIFKSKGGGTAALDLNKTTLVLDDIEPCDVDNGVTQPIEHSAAGASVSLEGGDDGGSGVLIASVAGVVVAVVVVAVAGFLWYRRSGTRPQA